MAQRNDLSIYERCAADWWNPRAPAFRSLHAVNQFRVALLRDWIGDDLHGKTVVDFGCGGGLLSAPMRACGARVVGLDLSRASLAAACARVEGSFLQADVLRAPLAPAIADVVLLADVIEHVSSFDIALREASRLLRPGGVIYVNTINKTRRAKWLAVDLAEGLGLVPRGTHDPQLFVEPRALVESARRHALTLEHMQGEAVDLARTIARWAISLRRAADVSVGYSALLRKAPSS